MQSGKRDDAGDNQTDEESLSAAQASMRSDAPDAPDAEQPESIGLHGWNSGAGSGSDGELGFLGEETIWQPTRRARRRRDSAAVDGYASGRDTGLASETMTAGTDAVRMTASSQAGNQPGTKGANPSEPTLG